MGVGIDKIPEGQEQPDGAEGQQYGSDEGCYSAGASGPDDGQAGDQDDLKADQEEKSLPVRAEKPVFLVNGGDAQFADPRNFGDEVDV